MTLRMPYIGKNPRGKKTSSSQHTREQHSVATEYDATDHQQFYLVQDETVKYGSTIGTISATAYPHPISPTTLPATGVGHRYILLMDSGGNFLVCDENQLPTLEADAAVYYPIYRQTANGGWVRWQNTPSITTPPPPPIIIITSSGGEDFPIMFGSNPYVITASIDAASVLSFWWIGFNGGGSYSPQIEGGSPGNGPGTNMEYNGQPEVYPYGTDWKTLEFGPAAAAGDHWPVPHVQSDAGDIQDSGVCTALLLAYEVWQAWTAAHFGITVSPYGETPRFGANALWNLTPPHPTGALGQGDPEPGRPTIPGPTFIEERMYVRGQIDLPALQSGATVTAISAVEVTDGIFFNDDTYLNQSATELYFGSDHRHVDLGGGTAGSTPYGTVFTADVLYTLPWWIFGGSNLLAFKVAGWYWNADALVPVNNGSIHTTGGTYVEFTFTVDNHTDYAPPPDNWQTTGGGSVFVTATTTTAVDTFGYISDHAIDLGNVGTHGRAYFRQEFVIPASTPTAATLDITALTGIGAIYINGTSLALPSGVSETTHLWDVGRVLNLTIPVGLLVADGVTNNELAVQCYSETGPCKLIYKLTIT